MNEEAHRKYHHGRMKPVEKKVINRFVWVNEVEYRYEELLGYIEGLKNANEAKPMPVYNANIVAQFVGDKIAQVVDERGSVHWLININEEHRAEFEKEIRALQYHGE